VVVHYWLRGSWASLTSLLQLSCHGMPWQSRNRVVGWGYVLQAERSEFETRWRYWTSLLTQSFQAQYSPGVDSASNRNHYLEPPSMISFYGWGENLGISQPYGLPSPVTQIGLSFNASTIQIRNLVEEKKNTHSIIRIKVGSPVFTVWKLIPQRKFSALHLSKWICQSCK
jgi:hypothetical protein